MIRSGITNRASLRAAALSTCEDTRVLPVRVCYGKVRDAKRVNIDRYGTTWRINSSELDEIDPMTGEVITGTFSASRAPTQLPVGRFNWAYREADIPANANTAGKVPVVCLHGLGSSSYAYRNTIRLLAQDGFRAIALDWIAHGASDAPNVSEFSYTKEAYIQELEKAIESLNLNGSFCLVVHGYVLGQYAMLYAARHPDMIKRMVILNTPLGLKSKLRPELAAYKSPIPFMKPKVDSTFDGRNYNAAGGPYALSSSDADAYNVAYASSPAANAALYHTMEALDWESLLKEVNETYYSWKVPTLVLHGSGDTFLDLKLTLDWLESKRTAMKMASGLEAKLGHMPQEDYPQAIHPILSSFLSSSEQ